MGIPAILLEILLYISPKAGKKSRYSAQNNPQIAKGRSEAAASGVRSAEKPGTENKRKSLSLGILQKERLLFLEDSAKQRRHPSMK